MLANTMLGDKSIIALIAGWLDPSARLMGLDGVILLAFILGLPANEIVVPIIVMAYLAEGTMTEPDSLEGLRNVLISNGWTPITALCTMLFSLLHFPCGTTLLTIKKETQSLKWPVLSALITTSTAAITCFIVYQSAKLLNLV
jgi:ferrous iron transport protein B